MMKKSLYALLLLFVVSVSACKKEEDTVTTTYNCVSPCETCTKAGTSGALTFCRADYNTDDVYEAYIATYEVQGYSCVKATATPSNTEVATTEAERESLEDDGYECTKN